MEPTKRNERTIEDGFGSRWLATCSGCGAETQVIRPGKAQCSECDTYPTEVIDVRSTRVEKVFSKSNHVLQEIASRSRAITWQHPSVTLYSDGSGFLSIPWVVLHDNMPLRDWISTEVGSERWDTDREYSTLHFCHMRLDDGDQAP